MKLTKKDKKQIQIWVNALRSGEYKQTKRKLQDESGYCCLGVACKVLNFENKLDDKGNLKGFLPVHQLNSPLWLMEINKDFSRKTHAAFSLIDLNDNSDFSFEEISDIIEAVYLFGVLN